MVASDRRYQVALERSRAAWAGSKPARAARLAGCVPVPGGVRVPYFGAPHLLLHPGGEVIFEPTGQAAHPSVTVLLLHYLLTADGSEPAGRWLAFRELPSGLFYSQAFAAHAEAPLAARFGSDLAAFRQAAGRLAGAPLDLADASSWFLALPRVPIAALLWEGDDEFPARAQILFDAQAGHYLPTEDLSGVGDWLAHRLMR